MGKWSTSMIMPRSIIAIMSVSPRSVMTGVLAVLALEIEGSSRISAYVAERGVQRRVGEVADVVGRFRAR